MITFDSAGTAPIDAAGTHRGKSFDQAYRTADGRTVDSTGAFLIGELERLDPVVNAPLAAVTYSRDIPLRQDVGIGDESASFTLSSFAASGGPGGAGATNGISWIGKASDQITGVSVDLQKIVQPLTPWGKEIKFTVLELESAARLGRPIDSQKLEVLNLNHQMDTDQVVYIGDTTRNVKGLLNHNLVTNVANVANGASGSGAWANKTPQEILNDINEAITSTWAASGWAVMPDSIRIPPKEFGYISTATISSAGNVSILKYLLENNVLVTSGRGTLDIQPVKWAMGTAAGGVLSLAGGAGVMLVYSKDPKYVQFPMTPLQKTPIQYDSIYHKTTYYGLLGCVEMRYAETVAYRLLPSA